MITVKDLVQSRYLLDNEVESESTEVIKRFDSLEDVKNILLNREPYIFVDKAVAFKQKIEGKTKNRLLSQLVVTERHCQGHYPGYPMLPFAMMGEIIGQAGAMLLLSAYKKEIGDAVPLAVKVTNLKSGNSGPVFPGDILNVMVEVLRMRGGFAVLTATMGVREEIVVTLDEASFWAVKLPLSRDGNQEKK